jgi:hypothetical protein
MAMTERDRKVMIVVVALALLGAFWFLVISPKRSALAEAKQAKADAQAQLDTAIQAETAAKTVKVEKPEAYAKLIKLGAAIPVDDDFESLLVQVNDLSDGADVEFSSLSASSAAAASGVTSAVGGSVCDPEGTGATGAAAGATPAAPASPATGATGTTGSTAQTWVGRSREKAQNAAAEAEARNQAVSCASAPTLVDLSAQAAGLDSYKYQLIFSGSYFNLTSLVCDLLAMVKTRNGKVSVTGRLLDVNTITMTVTEFPLLNASVQLTGYSMPLTSGSAGGGATPATGVPAASPAPAG